LEELLDIRVVVTHQHYQHYDQEYDFPESDPFFVSPRAIELIPEADPKHRRWKRGIRSGLLV
jgi:L-ascorbate metabolism protein UlaG (beta-lactamase superfamily)